MRNVITINPELHQRFRAHVVVQHPRTTMGAEAEKALEFWIDAKAKINKWKRSTKKGV
jgi:hypothetical protein